MQYNSSPHSDGYPIGSDSGSKSPTISEYVDGSTSGRSAQSDEELMITLASSRPKKPAGRKKFKETRHPVYRGVRKRNNDKWVCELREPNKKSRLWLGTYPTAEMAARAHDVAALALKGESSSSTPCLNFADSVWRLPVPVSKEAEHIRKAAGEAAEAFRPQPPGDDGGVAVSPDGSRRDIGIEVFDMEGLISNMAEGPLLSPSPSCLGRGFSWDDVGSDGEMSLWS
ncbi:dehydration-responsive element-binding protein 1E-like [Rhododendron vialii]|uniref:dehydration-responsive element-binding protein 1E-like n=1 Tax=Rhododendron vialii TaxID=182163 RepID=UPI0026605A47|nr:dehydration-responsive element-binding protein 1E-like [Rhododendron vialii]